MAEKIRPKTGIEIIDFLKYGAIGGLVSGILGGIPILSIANACCLWTLLGGFVAGFLLKKNKGAIEPVQGAIAGLVAGIVGALVATILGTLFSVGITMITQMVSGADPVGTAGALVGVLFGALIGAVLNLIIWPIASAIGGAIPALMK